MTIILWALGDIKSGDFQSNDDKLKAILRWAFEALRDG